MRLRRLLKGLKYYGEWKNIKIKKIAISNPLARKDLEDFYTFKQLLNSSFNKTKSEMKTEKNQNL